MITQSAPVRMFSAVNDDLSQAESAFDAAPSWEAYNRCWLLDCEVLALYADVRPRYVCEWERENAPTRGMTETAARAYWKAHSVSGDCLFALRPDSGLPQDIVGAWASLALAVDAAPKETAEHRACRDAIRTAVRRYLGGQDYTLPAAPIPQATRRSQKAKLARTCPHCGLDLAVA